MNPSRKKMPLPQLGILRSPGSTIRQDIERPPIPDKDLQAPGLRSREFLLSRTPPRGHTQLAKHFPQTWFLRIILSAASPHSGLHKTGDPARKGWAKIPVALQKPAGILPQGIESNFLGGFDFFCQYGSQDHIGPDNFRRTKFLN